MGGDEVGTAACEGGPSAGAAVGVGAVDAAVADEVAPDRALDEVLEDAAEDAPSLFWVAVSSVAVLVGLLVMPSFPPALPLSTFLPPRRPSLDFVDAEASGTASNAEALARAGALSTRPLRNNWITSHKAAKNWEPRMAPKFSRECVFPRWPNPQALVTHKAFFFRPFHIFWFRWLEGNK